MKEEILEMKNIFCMGREKRTKIVKQRGTRKRNRKILRKPNIKKSVS
jgi:hypothetical protein